MTQNMDSNLMDCKAPMLSRKKWLLLISMAVLIYAMGAIYLGARILLPDGSGTSLALFASMVLISLILAAKIFKYVNEMETLAQSLRQSEERFRSLVENSCDCIWEADQDGAYTYVSPKVKELLGYSPEEVITKTIFDLRTPKDAKRIRRVFYENATERIPFQNLKNVILHKHGHEVIIETSGSPILDDEGNCLGFRGMDRDITRKTHMEEVMIQSEKMLSVGGLAAGMAHELNNPLGGIAQNIQVLRNRMKKGVRKNEEVAKKCGLTIDGVEEYAKQRDIFQMIDSALDSSQRAAKIIENMLSFSNKSKSQFSNHNMIDLVECSLDLASKDYSLKKRYDFRQIRINRFFPKDPPIVPCEANLIQQVIFNILRNGAHSMVEKTYEDDSPCFNIRIENRTDHIRLEIEDNGPGMNAGVRKRIFEPFFTTKDTGVGSGLGLSVSYFIITEKHGGEICVESEPGHGARFILQIPLTNLPDLQTRETLVIAN